MIFDSRRNKTPTSKAAFDPRPDSVGFIVDNVEMKHFSPSTLVPPSRADSIAAPVADVASYSFSPHIKNRRTEED
jgi:hypothetical protein